MCEWPVVDSKISSEQVLIVIVHVVNQSEMQQIIITYLYTLLLKGL